MKKFFTNKTTTLLVAIFLLLISGNLNAQTVIPVGASQTYTKIQTAYNTGIPSTIAGAYVIELQSDYDPTTETYPISLGAKTGASITNTITIKPATGAKITLANPLLTKTLTGAALTNATAATFTLPDVTGLSTSSYVSGIGTYTGGTFKQLSAVDLVNKTVTVPAAAVTSTQSSTTLFFGPVQTQTIYFNGANYVTIDGVSRTDATTGLIIQNPNSIYSNTIYFNTGTYNTVKNCFIKGTNQTGSHNNGYCGQIFFNGGSYNTVTQNEICDIDGYPLPICLVTFNNGTANNTVSYNNMYNVGTEISPNGNAGFFQFPSSLSGSNNSVLYNKMYWTKAAKFNTGPSLIGMGSVTGIGHRIENNVIGYTNPDGTGTASLSAIATQTALTLSVMSVKNCTLKNNIIGGISGSFKAFNGILITGHGATSTATGDNYCYGNQVKDISVSSTASGATLIGIQTNITNAFSVNVKNNIVSNLSLTSSVAANTCVTTGIDQTGTASAYAYNYSGNRVNNLVAGLSGTTASATANVCYGMKVGANASLVEKNLVYNIYVPNSSGVIRGIQLEGSNTTGTTFQNNIIRLGVDASASYSLISGFYQNAATNAGDPVNYYHNSVYIGGTSNSGAAISSVFNRNSTKTPSYTFKNNIFSNKRSGNSIVNEIYIISHLRNIAASDKNLYEYSTQFAQKSIPSATFATLDSWNTMRTDSTLSTDGSINQTSPQFVDPTNATAPDLTVFISALDGTGIDLSGTVADDFLGNSRLAGNALGFGTSDIGAYAFRADFPVVVTPAQANGVKMYSANNNIVINGANGKKAVVYSIDGQAIYSNVLNNDIARIALQKGIYIISVDGVKSKIRVQ